MWCLGGVTAFTCDGWGPSRVQGLLRFKPLGSTAVLGSYDRQMEGQAHCVTPSPEGFWDPTVPSPGSETEEAVLGTGVP